MDFIFFPEVSKFFGYVCVSFFFFVFHGKLGDAVLYPPIETPFKNVSLFVRKAVRNCLLALGC